MLRQGADRACYLAQWGRGRYSVLYQHDQERVSPMLRAAAVFSLPCDCLFVVCCAFITFVVINLN